MTGADAQPRALFDRGRITAVVVLVAISALHFGLPRTVFAGESDTALASYLIWIAASLLAGSRSLLTARRAATQDARMAWTWFGVGAIGWGVGIALELLSLSWVDSHDIIIGARRALYVAYPLSLLGGLFVLARTGRRTLDLANIANIGAIGSAMLVCALLMLLEPVLTSNEGAGYVLFSITDLTSLFTATIVAFHLLWSTNVARFRAVVLLLGCSAIVHAGANIGFYSTVFRQGTYDTGLDIYWTVALLLHYWAAQEQDTTASKPPGRIAENDWLARTADTAQVLLPAALILAVIATATAFPEHLTLTFAKAALLPIALFAVFVGLREWALDRHRERLVSELQESNSLHTHLLRASPGVVVICGTGKGFPLLYVSESGLLEFGVTADNFDFAIHVHEDDRRNVRDCLRDARKKGESSTEFRIRNPDGQWRWVDFRTILRHDASGQPTELIGTAIDVTERRELQQAIQQTQRLESLGRLSGSVAHDFNNLLTTILGFADVLLHSPGLSPGDRDKIEEIRTAGERGAALTRQLLTFSRRHSVATAPIDVNVLIMDMRGMMERLLGDSVNLDFRPCEFPVTVRGNRNQLEQVVMNLILNARDAMPDGGRIEVATGQTTVASHADGGGQWAVISVTDGGKGMDEIIQGQIFDPFFTTKDDGTGLGLATAHGIVRQHKGRINVTSQPGEGTRIEVLLPVAEDGAIPETRSADDAPSMMGSERILVVDDQPAITRVIASALEPRGYTVHTASSADEALDIAAEHEFDLLLSDVVMPDCNGYELVRRLREVQPRFLVVYMSGYTDDVLARHEVREEDALLLQKPFVVDQLAAAIRQKLDSGMRRSAQS